MDRKLLKSNAKSVFFKKYWPCVVVGLLMTLGGASGSIRFNVNVNNESGNGNYFESYVNSFSNFLSEGEILAVSLVTFFGIIAVTLLGIFVFSVLRCGGIRYFLKLRKNQSTEISETVENFKDKTFIGIAKTTFLTKLRIFLWTLLFIIPGIVKGYEYRAVDYILAVRPDIDTKEALALSSKITYGKKAEWFLLDLSFIGWNILNAFSFGILGVFFLNPYIEATNVEFFCAIKDEAIAKGIITPADIPDYNYVPEQNA